MVDTARQSCIRILAFSAAIFGLAACNSTLDQRTQKRIATGAIIGAVSTVVVDGSPIRGAIVGGVVGGLTSKNRHVWE